MSEASSEQLVEQSIRNRVIDYLELAASAENQCSYERNVPIAVVLEEMVEHWPDLMNGAHIDDVLAEQWIVFSDAEKKAMRDFHPAWVATCEATPMPMPRSIEDLLGTPVWDRFMGAARVALQAFEARDRFSEDVEERFGS